MSLSLEVLYILVGVGVVLTIVPWVLSERKWRQMQQQRDTAVEQASQAVLARSKEREELLQQIAKVRNAGNDALALARRYREQYGNKPPEYVAIRPYLPNDGNYLSGIYQQTLSPVWQWFCHRWREELIAKIASGPQDNREGFVGMLTGFDLMQERLHEIAVQYQALESGEDEDGAQDMGLSGDTEQA